MSQPNPVFVVTLPKPLQEYLLHVITVHVGGGLPVEELVAAAELYKRVKYVKEIDFSQLGDVQAEALSPNHIALELEPNDGRQEPA